MFSEFSPLSGEMAASAARGILLTTLKAPLGDALEANSDSHPSLRSREGPGVSSWGCKKSPEDNQQSPGGVSGQDDHLFRKNETKSTKRSEERLKNPATRTHPDADNC